MDKVKHAVSGLKHTEQYNLPAFLTSVLTACLPKALQVEWEVHSRESRDVPPLDDFLKFVSFRADVLANSPSTPSDTKQKPSDIKLEHAPRKYHRAAVNAATPKPSSAGPSGFRYECILCPGLKHPLFTCDIFNNKNVQGREDHIRYKLLSSRSSGLGV